MPCTARPDAPSLSSGMRRLIGSALCAEKLSDMPEQVRAEAAGDQLAVLVAGWRSEAADAVDVDAPRLRRGAELRQRVPDDDVGDVVALDRVERRRRSRATAGRPACCRCTAPGARRRCRRARTPAAAASSDPRSVMRKIGASARGLRRDRPLAVHDGLRVSGAARGVDDERVVGRRHLPLDGGEELVVGRVRARRRGQELVDRAGPRDAVGDRRARRSGGTARSAAAAAPCRRRPDRAAPPRGSPRSRAAGTDARRRGSARRSSGGCGPARAVS